MKNQLSLLIFISMIAIGSNQDNIGSANKNYHRAFINRLIKRQELTRALDNLAHGSDNSHEVEKLQQEYDELNTECKALEANLSKSNNIINTAE